MEIKYVHHISNILIHPHKRFDEYLEIFEQLLLTIKNENGDEIIVITGDMFESDHAISAHSLVLIHKLFSMCTYIPIIILGDNSFLLQTIVNIYYRKQNIAVYDDGYYELQNIYFSVNKPYDDQIKSKHHILLGNDTGIDKLDFYGFDFVLLGNYSKEISPAKNISVRSLIQQDHSDIFKYGINKINLLDKKIGFIPIRSNYGFCTIRIINDKIKLLTDISEFKNITVKFVTNYVDDQTLDTIVNSIKKKYTVESYQVIYEEVLQSLDSKVLQSLDSKVLQSLDSDLLQSLDTTNIKTPLNITTLQNQLIYMKRYMNVIGLKHKKRILKMHVVISKSILHTNLYVNNFGTVNLLQIKFDNIMCYGSGNVIDFRRYEPNTMIAITGNNYVGKSSILDIILFGLFDRTSRANRGEIININATDLFCSVLFQIGSNHYVIERHGKKSAQGNIVTNVRFWLVNLNNDYSFNVKKQLHHKQKCITNNIIANYVGTFIDYVSTTFMLHKNTNSIMDEVPMKQKTGLCRALQLDVFDVHHTKIKEIISTKTKKIDELNLELKILSGQIEFNDMKYLEMEQLWYENICKQNHNLDYPSKFIPKYKFDYLFHQSELTKINMQIELVTKFNRLKEKITKLKYDMKICFDYKKVTHADMIPFELLKTRLPVLERNMNLKLKTLGMHEIKIVVSSPGGRLPVTDGTDIGTEIAYVSNRLKKSTIKIFMCKNGKLASCIGSGCGLEKMITDIVFRISLSELSIVPKTNIFVIDEELSYFDKSHLAHITKLIDMIKKQYQYVIIISHDNKITDLADYELKLERNEGENGHINNICCK